MPVELLTDPFTPLFAHLPDPARIANVSTLQGDLRTESQRASSAANVPQAEGPVRPACLSRGTKPVFTECLPSMPSQVQMYPQVKGPRRSACLSRVPRPCLQKAFPAFCKVPSQETTVIHSCIKSFIRAPTLQQRERRATVCLRAQSFLGKTWGASGQANEGPGLVPSGVPSLCGGPLQESGQTQVQSSGSHSYVDILHTSLKLC